MQKYYQEVCLLEQAYVMDDSKKVCVAWVWSGGGTRLIAGSRLAKLRIVAPGACGALPRLSHGRPASSAAHALGCRSRTW